MDIDLERRLIRLNQPEKNGAARMFRISDKLASMLGRLRRNGERIFNASRQTLTRNFLKTRRRLAEKLNNARLQYVTFHTLRHWKATMEYHKTKDILHVKELLGHKHIDTTTIYIQIEKSLFNEQSDDFYSAVAKNIDEARKLIEAGFEYVCTFDNNMLFRKRK